MNDSVVCNASPLIFLSKIDRLHLLCDLFNEVFIPVSAWSEVAQKPDDVIQRLDELKSSGKVVVFTVQNRTAVSALIGRLHIGEVEVIVGADELKLSQVILDDGYARKKAKQMGLSVTGTLGILIAGYKSGIIDDLKTEIDKLVGIGFRVSSTVLEKIEASLNIRL